MTDEEILRGVAAVAREHVGHRGELRPGMRLVEDLELDSIRLLTLAVEVENRFRVRLDEADEAAIETVGDLVGVVGRKLSSGEAERAAAETSGRPRRVAAAEAATAATEPPASGGGRTG